MRLKKAIKKTLKSVLDSYDHLDKLDLENERLTTENDKLQEAMSRLNTDNERLRAKVEKAKSVTSDSEIRKEQLRIESDARKMFGAFSTLVAGMLGVDPGNGDAPTKIVDAIEKLQFDKKKATEAIEEIGSSLGVQGDDVVSIRARIGDAIALLKEEAGQSTAPAHRQRTANKRIPNSTLVKSVIDERGVVMDARYDDQGNTEYKILTHDGQHIWCSHEEIEEVRSEDPDKDRGLYGKYIVTRRSDASDPEGYKKHQDCEYFVLDLTHDKFSAAALFAYARACAEEYPSLSSDLHGRATSVALRFNVCLTIAMFGSCDFKDCVVCRPTAGF